jgi:RNA polymerase-binding transcription factor
MNAALNTTQLDSIRARLAARRRELRERLDRVSADQRRAAEPLSPDAPDRITQSANDAVIDEIGSAAHEELIKVDDALRRVETGHYGLCESCGHPIEGVRLAAVPYATRCVGCSTQPDRRLSS